MTDRGLLELAAKAAGWDTNPWTWSETAEAFRYRVGGDWIEWNPLTDDGDALRLAVKLRLEIRMSKQLQDTMVHRAFSDAHVEKWGSDAFAATRRAIVRAAAEIGREMP